MILRTHTYLMTLFHLDICILLNIIFLFKIIYIQSLLPSMFITLMKLLTSSAYPDALLKDFGRKTRDFLSAISTAIITSRIVITPHDIRNDLPCFYRIIIL